MNIGLDHLELVDRLRDRVAVARQVGLSADLAELEARTELVAPSLWVVPGDEEGTDQSDSGLVMQSIRQDVAIATVARNYRVSDRGAAQLDGLRAMRIAVRKELIGWRPAGCDRPLTVGPSRLLRYSAELIVWIDVFRTTYQLEAAWH